MSGDIEGLPVMQPKGPLMEAPNEFEDASHGSPDRLRGVGTSSLQGFRRTDYGSSVPTRGDSGGYSRGPHRWDSRSSGRGDTDSDSESGRCYGSLARSGQHPEHDGLLGSGSFPRPTGYAAGASSPRFRPNSSFHLNRSNEAYQPPRPFKAVPQSKRATKDTYNDETFGSADSTSVNKVEEEKKRRAEFELMRKEQQKALQEKQKLNSSKIEDSLSDITELLVNPTDGKMSDDLHKVLKQAQQDNSGKTVSKPTHPSRPCVPPGFVNSTVDNSSPVKSLMHGELLEKGIKRGDVGMAKVGKVELDNSHQDIKSTAQESDSHKLQCVTIPSASESGNMMGMPSVLHGADQVQKSNLTDVSEPLDDGEILWLDPEIAGHKILGKSGRSTSILEKLFGSSLKAGGDGASKLVEDQNAKVDDRWSPNALQSKFASWFLEEDKKTFGDTSQGKPHDLLALIAGSEKVGCDMSDVTSVAPILPPEMKARGHMAPKSATASSTACISEIFSTSNAANHEPAVLTCEDLEQSILSEVGGSGSASQHAEPEMFAVDEKGASSDTGVDNLASRHLLSLLQRGMGSKNVVSTSAVEEGFPERPRDQQGGETDLILSDINAIPERLNSSGKTLTLEALFGAAFMNELHFAQQNSVGSVRTGFKEPQGLPFLGSDGAGFSSAVNEIGNGIGSSDKSIFMSNNGITKVDNAGHLLGVHDHVKELDFSTPLAGVDLKFGGLDKGIEVRLPEEDNLITLGDRINARSSIMSYDSSLSRADLLHSLNSSINTGQKSGALGAALEDERSIIRGRDSLLFHGPHQMVKPELPYENLRPQVSSPYLCASQASHRKPLFDPLNPHDDHLDPHMKFIPPDAPIHHQLPVNMGHRPLPHHGAGHQGFDHPIPPAILQQMHMAGNLPSHVAGPFPGGPPMPPHSSHNPASYLQEHNPTQGFPFGQWQPNFGGPGMPPPGPEFGGAYNPPEACQRLLEMELRGNPRQAHPFAAGGHGRSIHGPELDMGFSYR
ncbi:hypothetical protein Cgig2_033452 [Carnegiea gigantea]|uniref:Uncharacterized protein n=1 Tax=Carnegiea gigantea TaxID=171969 RepID=A0A9Q1KWM5_9CARY|nr:hypothetical protein Cgig2_033452 [Carnegiea gigantea]